MAQPEAQPTAGEPLLQREKAKNVDLMKFWEMELCCQECYSGPLFIPPLKNKNQFYMLMDLITARRSEQIGKSQAEDDAVTVYWAAVELIWSFQTSD